MPNWCNNRLVITATPHALESLFSKAKTEDSEFSMNAFVTMPQELLDIKTGGCEIDGVRVSAWREIQQPDGTTLHVALTTEERNSLTNQHGTWNWYDWAVENWGTKWDVEASVELDAIEDGEAEVKFDSAWGPPSAFVAKLAAMFPALRIVHDYAEPGMCFGGRMTYTDGSLTESIETHDNAGTRMLSEWHAVQVGFDDEEEEQTEDENEEEDI